MASPTADSREGDATRSTGNALLRRERWPYRLVDSTEGQRTGGAGTKDLREPVGEAAAVKTVGGGTETGKIEIKKSADARDRDDAGGSNGAWGGHGAAGGGWRHPVSTALAISAVTDEASLAERERERCLHLFHFSVHPLLKK